jgi:hypothetical protein
MIFLTLLKVKDLVLHLVILLSMKSISQTLILIVKNLVFCREMVR